MPALARSSAVPGAFGAQFTVTDIVHSAVWPLGATARQTLFVMPMGNVEPLPKPPTKKGVNAPAQLSEAVGVP